MFRPELDNHQMWPSVSYLKAYHIFYQFNASHSVLGTALPGFRSYNPPWLRLSQSWDHKPLRRQSFSPWQVCYLCPLHPAWP